MRILLSALTLSAAIAMIAATVRPSVAQGPYHPYCALDSSSGATSLSPTSISRMASC